MASVNISLATLYPKIVGTVSLILGLDIVYALFFEGMALRKVSNFMLSVTGHTGQAHEIAMALSFGLAALAIFLGIRGILYNNICIGGQCKVKQH